MYEGEGRSRFAFLNVLEVPVELVEPQTQHGTFHFRLFLREIAGVAHGVDILELEAGEVDSGLHDITVITPKHRLVWHLGIQVDPLNAEHLHDVIDPLDVAYAVRCGRDGAISQQLGNLIQCRLHALLHYNGTGRTPGPSRR